MSWLQRVAPNFANLGALHKHDEHFAKEEEMTETSVVIVGGGIAGASMACALAHRHISSVLIERRSVPVDLNRGDGLQARSLEIMESWGVLKSIVEAGTLKSYCLEVH